MFVIRWVGEVVYLDVWGKLCIKVGEVVHLSERNCAFKWAKLCIKWGELCI